jgi:hypothetical protein
MNSVREKKFMALAGIAGAVIYGIADLFLYVGTDMFSENKLSLWQVPVWRLMASMWIAALGSLLMLLGYSALYKMLRSAFGKAGYILILPSLICFGGIMYMHFVLGVYEPLTYNSAMKASVSLEQFKLIADASKAALDPMMIVMILLGYSTDIILLIGFLSGKFGLKKRIVLFEFGGYAVLVLMFILVAKLIGDWGITGSLESLLETTFFIPAYLYWRKAEKAA